MVKIKDFTLASQNLGGTCPPVLYTFSAHEHCPKQSIVQLR